MREWNPIAAVLCCIALGSPLWADGGEEMRPELAAAYPKSSAELERWVKAVQAGGRARQSNLISVFGENYYHPLAGIDRNERRLQDFSTLAYDLDKLGVRDHGSIDVLILQFDPRSGLLLRAAVEEAEDRQTGFNINAATGANGNAP